MGLFKGKSWFDKNNQEYAFCLAWGVLVDDPRITCTNVPRVGFILKYHRKTFINCVAWGEGDNITVMSTLEKGDMVMVLGTYRRRSFVNPEGETKQYFSLNCEIVLPLSLIRHTLRLYSSGAINRIIDAENKAPSDAMESEFDEEEEEKFVASGKVVFEEVDDDDEELPF